MLVRERLEQLTNGNGPYMLEPLNNQAKPKLQKCLEEDADWEKLGKGILNAMCNARLYRVNTSKNKKEFLGIAFLLRTTVLAIEKPPLRSLSNLRAIASRNPEESVIHVFILGVDSSIMEFYFWLALGQPNCTKPAKARIRNGRHNNE